MILGEIVGTAVSTHKHYKVEGRKLLVVQPLSPEGQAEGRSLLAIDSVDAGIGDRVLVVQEGLAVQMVALRSECPLDAAVIAVVDSVSLKSDD